MLKYGPFTQDIEVLTPPGATILHAGRARLLDALVPTPTSDPASQARLASLAVLASEAEAAIRSRFRATVDGLDAWAGTIGLRVPTGQSAIREIEEDAATKRMDAAFHSAMKSPLYAAIRSRGTTNLLAMVRAGHVLRRRQANLQFTSIGFSEKHDDPRPGSYRLLEPNFIELDTSVPRQRWIWCPRPLLVVTPGAVIVSLEGSIGNVALLPTDDVEPTVSNIHGVTLDAVGPDRAKMNSWLVANLAYLREKGWLDAMSVGGQGGSLAEKYHDLVPIFDFDPVMGNRIHRCLAGGSAAPTVDDLMRADVSELRRVRRSLRQMGLVNLDRLRGNVAIAARRSINAAYPELTS